MNPNYKCLAILFMLVLVSYCDDQFEIKTTKEGDNTHFPKAGQSVTVHYTGTLTDGKKFDSSRDRGEPFVFNIGQGQVIKCWDQGVAQMSLGQRAILTCPSDIAYGSRGYPGLIPPRPTLIFDVELIAFSN